jgi:hypothetical protein
MPFQIPIKTTNESRRQKPSLTHMTLKRKRDNTDQLSETVYIFFLRVLPGYNNT